jgi:hypothetical protein
MSDEPDVDREAFLSAQAKIEAAKSRRRAPVAGRAARRARERSLSDSVDRRTLRPAGRSVQWNIRCRQGLREEAIEAAALEGVSLAQWVEDIVEAGIAAAKAKHGGKDA